MSQSTRRHACTAQKESGQFCDAPTMPDVPFPICFRHAAQLYRFLRGRIDAAEADTYLDYLARDCAIPNDEFPMQQAHPAARGVVYYVQIGEHIKIGTTVNLTSRLLDYPPTRRLLATETGSVQLEHQRLMEFAEYLDLGREWFRPGARLMEHIAALPDRYGEPA